MKTAIRRQSNFLRNKVIGKQMRCLLKFISVFLIVFSVTGCTDGPNFDVKISLSQAALNKLKSLGETIKVIAYFDGDSKSGQDDRNAPFRDVYLGHKEVEIEFGQLAQFRGIKFYDSDYHDLKDGIYYITLNVISGRKVERNNLLDCSVPVDAVDKLRNKTTEVYCKLINE